MTTPTAMRLTGLLLIALLVASCGDEDSHTRSYAVLEPEAWVGKVIDETELAQHLDVAALPDDGIWILWRDCCASCAELFAYVATVERGEQPIVLVRIPGGDSCKDHLRVRNLPKGKHVIHVALPDDRDWVVTPPAVLVLRARRVIFGAQGVTVTTYVHIPAWARVAAEQVAEATERGLPVAFENDLGMRFVLIPAGTSLLGSPPSEEGRQDDETQHEVTITKPYYVSIHEVANAPFRAFEPDHASFGLQTVAADGGARVDADALPVTDVSWDESTRFAEWLAARDASRSYRLPTEAEWEHACRAGTTTPFWWGPTAEAGRANYDVDGTYVGGPADARRRGLMPVGSFPPNPWGLYDVHGNVLEWCADWYAPYTGDATTDPQGPTDLHAPRVTTWLRTGEDARESTARARVQRGGGWSQLPRFFRSAARLRGDPSDRQDYFGFRLVSPIPGPGE